MTVDLTKLKAGDTVHFRCGGSAVVESHPRWYCHGAQWLMFNGKERQFDNNGNYWIGSHDGKDPFDIIRIEPKAFDWDEVKAGMGFMYDERPVRYMGHHPEVKDMCCCYFIPNKAHESCQLGWFFKDHLTRAPEHDLEAS